VALIALGIGRNRARSRESLGLRSARIRTAKAFLLALATASAAAGAPSLRFHSEPAGVRFGAVEAAGLDAALLASLEASAPARRQWAAAFGVFLGEAPGEPDRPPILGRYEIADGSLWFTPRYPLLAGRRHTARLDLSALRALAGDETDGAPEVLIFGFDTPPPADKPAPRVTAVDPGGETLPANLLRFYIHFSLPMARGDVYRHIALLDENGVAIPDPFVTLDEPLWDRDGRRLTLLFHPGRIKRDLVPNRELGLALSPGKRYRLAVKATLRDAFGEPLAASFEKAFAVAAPDRRSPDPGRWRIGTPPAGTTAPLAVLTDEPLDRAQFARALRVQDPDGRTASGTIEVSRNGTAWTLIPDRPWLPGEHQLLIEPWLEDLAGNTPTRLFDADTATGTTILRDEQPIARTFTLSPVFR